MVQKKIISIIREKLLFTRYKIFRYIYPEWSSVAGNVVYRYTGLPDMCLAAIELGRRGFEFYHQYILKDKQEEKNIIFDNSKFAQEKVCQSLEELSTNLKFTTMSDTL